MKRSQINRIMEESKDFLERMRFLLPPFAFWTPEDWRRKGPECREIVENRLGWDITDFGGGDFESLGLFMFTIRNGDQRQARRGEGKTYCEKILISRPGQATPAHFHFFKMEDIINRGGADLIVQLWNSTPEESLDDTEVRVSTDGVERTVPAGGKITLRPGESVALPTRLYHSFWAAEGENWTLIGEVSRVNDDMTDNRFLEPAKRFADIEEDEPPLHLLMTDYEKHYSG